jgi:hypothetical protein
VRREVYDNPFFHGSMFSFCRGYKLSMAELGEFCFVSHDLIFNSNLFTCRLKGPVRREIYVNPFFHGSMFSLCRDYKLGMAELGQFYFVSHDLMFDSYLFTCRVKCPVRREVYVNPFFHGSMFSLCRDYKLGMAELCQFYFVSYDLMFDSDLFTCHLKGPVRREVYINPFFHSSMFSICRGYKLGMAELGEFCFVSHDLIFNSNLFTCHFNGPVRREV